MRAAVLRDGRMILRDDVPDPVPLAQRRLEQIEHGAHLVHA